MITYIKGDATKPQYTGVAIIPHICNDQGRWGKGFVLALSKRWPEPELNYREWHKTPTFKLGNISLVEIHSQLYVCNMLAQHGISPIGNVPPIRYESLELCLTKLNRISQVIIKNGKKLSIHMPRIGCGLAGGTWDKVEPIIIRCLADFDVNVYDI